MEKFVVIGQHHQHPTRNLKLDLPQAKHYAHVAVKDGEKVLDTKCVVEHAVYISSMSLQHQVRHTVPYLNKPEPGFLDKNTGIFTENTGIFMLI